MKNRNNPHSGKITIYDVAKKAGVSSGTVSRVLNMSGYISENTREQVLDAVNELGYVPNRAGRILKTSKTGLIMLAIPDTSNEIYFGMIEAVQSAAKMRGYSMVLYYTNGQHSEEMRAVRMLQECVVDGLILIHFSYKIELWEAIRQADSPVVLCGMCNSLWADPKWGVDTISIDVYSAIYEATCHLIGMGHRKIAYLAGTKGIEVYEQRYQAFRKALADHGIDCREDWIFFNDYTDDSGYSAGRTLFCMSDRPTAVCASNDLQAIGCWRAVRDSGGSIPGDIALIGLDNLKITQMLNISSVNMCEGRVGEIAAKLLFGRMDESDAQNRLPSQSIYIRPELITRSSTLVHVR